ncbi:MAG TPA: hypothetical protein VFV42_03175, partial [Acidimicrobiales bacterium]|nr:hypothetical protein [Acidimicrobiales bacterium]
MRGPRQIVGGVLRRLGLRRPPALEPVDEVRPDYVTLIHAVKNDVIGEVRGINDNFYALSSSQQAIVDHHALTGARAEALIEAVGATRAELQAARQEVMDTLERMAPLARARFVYDARLSDIDEPTAGVINYLLCHRGPLADVGLWRNEPVVVEWLPGDARVAAVNERIVEQPFVYGVLADLPTGSRIADVGGAESLVGLSLASSGHQVTVVEPAGYPYEHPNLAVVERTLDEVEVDEPVDAVVLLSAIEHFGLGAYADNGALDDDADLAAMKRVRELLAPGGRVVLTT